MSIIIVGRPLEVFSIQCCSNRVLHCGQNVKLSCKSTDHKASHSVLGELPEKN